MAKKFLVTGGTGFLGSALVRKLVFEGHDVRVFDNNWRGAKSKLGETINHVEFIEGDIRDFKKVDQACEGIDVICHLAFINGTEYFYSIPETVLDVGVTGMMNVVKAGMKHSVPDLVVASSSEVYQKALKIPTDESAALTIPDPLNPRYSYAGGKILSELITINYGRKYFKRAVIFRPHNVYGPDMGWEHVVPQFCQRMKGLINRNQSRIPFPIQGSGKETRAFIYVDDFTDGLYRVILKGKHLNIYHIGSQEEVSIRRVAEEVAHAFSTKIKIIAGQSQPGGTPRRCPDISKLKKLGFSPKISLRDGIFRTAHWYAQNNPTESKSKLKGSR